MLTAVTGATGFIGRHLVEAFANAGTLTFVPADESREANAMSGTMRQLVNNMVNGSGDVHSAMIALQRAETMLELTVQVRNKLVQAYQDVMRMPM